MPKKTRPGHSAEVARQELKDVVGCMSCGLPMKRTQREVASELADLCPSCVDKSGHLKSYDEVFEGLVTKHYMKKESMSRSEAEKVARQRMSELPAWKDAETST